MSFLEVLESLMEKNNIKNLSELSKKSNIPYTTFKNFYTRGINNVGISTLKKIAKFFDVTLDYLVYGDLVVKCSEAEFYLLRNFRNLSEQGKDYIRQTRDLAKDKYKKESSNAILEDFG